MTRIRNRKRSALSVVVAIVAVLVVLVFAAAGFEIADTARGYSMDYDARDYLYAAESGRYGDLYDTAMRDMDKDATYSAEVMEYRALAFYYEQAVLEHAYRQTGGKEKADAFAQRMAEYESELGSMSPKAEDIRSRVTARDAAKD